VVLSVLLVNGLNPSLLVLVATSGNVLGSVVNYALGYTGGKLFKKKFATASEDQINASLARFERFGVISLLFAWVPVIGDPLTAAAGVLKINLPLFLLLVTIGKLGRYIAVVWFVQ
jgi:membrane protein YqaA with SNARE-associated domain